MPPSAKASGVEPPDTGDAPDDQLLREERVGQVQAALGRLSDEYRMAIILREMEGLGYESIAEILGISVGTVRSRLHRARSLMRDHLGHIREDAS